MIIGTMLTLLFLLLGSYLTLLGMAWEDDVLFAFGCIVQGGGLFLAALFAFSYRDLHRHR